MSKCCGTSGRINLVANDTRPKILVQMKDKVSKEPINLAPANVTVFMKFREEGASTSLFEMTATKVGTGETGITLYEFPVTGLQLDEGDYEGEVRINEGTNIDQTIFDIIEFFLRKDFGDVVV